MSDDLHARMDALAVRAKILGMPTVAIAIQGRADRARQPSGAAISEWTIRYYLDFLLKQQARRDKGGTP